MYVISSTSGGPRNRISDSCCWDNRGYPYRDFPRAGTIYVATNPSREKTSGSARVDVDWIETQGAYVLMADLPGLKKEEVRVEAEEGRLLKLSGQRIRETQENGEYHRSERSHGKFLRKFRLPEDANMDAIKAIMEDGVLTVTIPKREQEKTQPIEVEISG